MPGMLGDISTLGRRGWTWWTSELAAMVPGRAAFAVNHPAVAAVVSVDGDGGLQILDEPRRGRGNRDGEGDAAGGRGALLRLARTRPGASVRLQLPAEALFVRHVAVPAAARSDAGAILALDLERSTPFRSKDVYVAHTLAPASGRKGWWQATQYVVKRKFADRAIAEVQALGIDVGSVDGINAESNAPLNVDFLQAARAGVASKPGRVMPLAMIALSAGLALSAAWIAITRREAALDQLHQTVAVARGKADVARQMQAADDAARQKVTAVRALKMQRPAMLEIINELTRLLPDDVVLTDLKIDGDTIEFTGVAKSAAAMTALLEKSAMFSGAQQTAPVTFDANVNKERLGLRLRLRHAPKTASVSVPQEEAPQ